MRINYFSPVRLTFALLAEIIERGGRIVYVSSVAARLSPPAEARVRGDEGRDLGVGRVHEGRPPRHRRQDPRRLPRRDRHRAVPPPRQRSAPRDRRRDAPGRRDGRARARRDRDRTSSRCRVPDWFNDVYEGKYKDVAAFLDGTIAFVRSQEGPNRREYQRCRTPQFTPVRSCRSPSAMMPAMLTAADRQALARSPLRTTRRLLARGRARTQACPSPRSDRRAAHLWQRLYDGVFRVRRRGRPRGRANCTPRHSPPGEDAAISHRSAASALRAAGRSS